MNSLATLGRLLDENWISVMYWGLILFAFSTLLKLNNDPTHPFKFYQLVSDEKGRADRYALAYLLMTGICLWVIWFTAITGSLSAEILGVILGAIVVGSLGKTWGVVSDRRNRRRYGGDRFDEEEYRGKDFDGR